VGDHLELKPLREEPELIEERGALVYRPCTAERLSSAQVATVVDELRRR
jgi:hypothetical protein